MVDVGNVGVAVGIMQQHRVMRRFLGVDPVHVAVVRAQAQQRLDKHDFRRRQPVGTEPQFVL